MSHKSLSHISFLLSEVSFGECQNIVHVRRRICKYGDKQNYVVVLPQLTEAGKEM